MQELKKAVAYYRVSSPEQEKNQTIESQKISLAQFAKDQYEIVAHFEDDGKSGAWIKNRTGFQACLQFIGTGKADALLVFMVDRIGRFADRDDRNDVIRALRQNRTSVHSADPDEGLFRYDNPDEMDALEDLLNESRRFNVKLSKRVRRGHATHRARGAFSGGHVPYGIAYDAKTETFSTVEKEYDALKEIFSKTGDELYGLIPLCKHLNEHLDRFPKRERKWKDRPHHMSRWLPIGIRYILHNDFYFTGVVQPTPANRARGLLPVDTGIKLFDQAIVERARRESAARRFRNIDEKLEGRKRTHGQVGTAYFTDYLLHGLARCGRCGWLLGKDSDQRRPGGRVYRYYRCRGRQTGDCDGRAYSAPKLEKLVWEKFVKALSDPTAMQEQILRGDFLVDTDRKAQKALLTKAKKDLAKLSGTLERTKKMFQWGDLTETKYQQDVLDIGRTTQAKQQEIARLEAALQRPKEVEAAVKAATRLVATQMESIRAAERLQELLAKVEAAHGQEHLDLEEEIEALQHKKSEYLSALIASGINRPKGIKGPEFRAEVDEMIWKQKRALLQQFVDFDKERGIRVFDRDKVLIYISIKSLGSFSRHTRFLLAGQAGAGS